MKQTSLTPPERRKNKYRKKEVLDAIKGSAGIKTAICNRLGCARNTFDRYLRVSACVRQAYEEERESVKDLVESKILKMIREENPAVIMFVAKTLLKDRGFTERNELVSQSNIVVLSADESEY